MNWNGADGNEVHKQTIWIERVRKELNHRLDKETFSVDPHNLKRSTLTKPVSQRPKRFLDKDALTLESFARRLKGETVTQTMYKEVKPQLPDHLDQTLSAVHKTPKDKYESAQTEAQEIGWVCRPLVVQPPGSRFVHPRQTCEITKYAAQIIGTSGVDPFKKSHN
eukprot:NODE_2476_length_689_cov_94.073437_g2024_i0.p1 GENE.NODE_2476_length_689_cov_94.073437_g2024_i0~~NODE_2476_length_689_cov_94.073437_g2024_i0.p1  ORF type:complete len:165 (+),score=20.40 NODE_2476_length_689_cov_94.073437_g2024_i0:79-573(+)